MLEETNIQTPPPGVPCTDEPIFTLSDSAQGLASIDDARSYSQATPASSGGPEVEPAIDATQGVWKISERVLGKDGSLSSCGFMLSPSVEARSIFQQMTDRGDYKRDPWERIPFPTGKEDYGRTSDLFIKIKLAIKGQTRLPDKDCALLTYWVFSTWLHVALPLAPGLAITGRAHEADVVLRTLQALCYHPVLLVGMNTATLDNIRWQLNPTLLIVEPALSTRMAVLLGCSTGRGYLARFKAGGGQFSPSPDYFGPKAIFVGEDLPANSALQHYLRINTSPAPAIESQRAAPLSGEMKQSIQNQLLSYRLHSLPAIIASDFKVSGLSPEVNTIAAALGRCIVDEPQLQAEIVSLLTPYSEQQLTERRDSLGMLAISATLTLCHQGKDQVLVGEIAGEVNRIQKERGERIQYSPEKIGHRLRKAGLLTRRLGAAGNGLLMDYATRAQLHEVADAYGCVGSNDNQEKPDCTICHQNQ